jgi:hypothetical protein
MVSDIPASNDLKIERRARRRSVFKQGHSGDWYRTMADRRPEKHVYQGSVSLAGFVYLARCAIAPAMIESDMLKAWPFPRRTDFRLGASVALRNSGQRSE